MKLQNFWLLTLCLTTLLALGTAANTQAQSRLKIDKPAGGTPGVVIQNPSTGSIIFKLGTEEKMWLTEAGLLSVGSSPLVDGAAMQVYHSDPAKSIITFRNNQSSSGSQTGGYVGAVQKNTILWNWENGSMFFGTNANLGMTLDATGKLGIGTATPGKTLDVIGEIRGNKVFAGAVELTSDAHFKKDIQTLASSQVAKVDQVRGVSYRFRTAEFKKRNFSEKSQMGVVAQELIKVYPELVSKDSEGYYSVNYTGLIPVLVEAVKDLRKKNRLLKDDNQAIKVELGTLKARMAALEKLLIKAKK